TIRLFVPNALAPNGFNREFRPVILSGNIAAYEMQIFDRYGSIVFFSDSPDEAWKGKKEGRKLPQGVYVYRIYLKLENGNEVEKKGHVLLLR
ncbi:MAG TPA: gliding motility-associated C-terminal domain-containing protein, partial [Bacteroidetes bacterium]|nr:gliding motility-associated C-terminal domain-containing protein [Bacteroidota bacterium]